MSIKRHGNYYRMDCDVIDCPSFICAQASLDAEQRLSKFAELFHTTRASGYHFCLSCVDKIIEADLSGERCKLKVVRG